MADLANAYAAGLFDGEGCVEVYMRLTEATKHRNRDRSLRCSLSVCGTDFRPLEWLKIHFGGSVSVRHDPPRKPIGKWAVFGHEAESFAREIRPFLLVKAEQVDLWFVAREMVGPRGFKGALGQGLTEDEIGLRRDLVAHMKELKSVG